jgi:thymidylate kinase
MLLIFEGVDKSGKTTAITKFMLEGKVDYYVKFSSPEEHGGLKALYEEYAFHLGIVKALQTKHPNSKRFQVFDRFFFSEYAYAKEFRNDNSDKDGLEQFSYMLKAIPHKVIFYSIDYETFTNRAGTEFNSPEQLDRVQLYLKEAVAKYETPENVEWRDNRFSARQNPDAVDKE